MKVVGQQRKMAYFTGNPPYSIPPFLAMRSDGSGRDGSVSSPRAMARDVALVAAHEKNWVEC